MKEEKEVIKMLDMEKFEKACKEIGGKFHSKEGVCEAGKAIIRTYPETDTMETYERQLGGILGGDHIQISGITDITAYGPSRYRFTWEKAQRVMWVHSKDAVLMIHGDGRTDIRI